MMGLDNCVVLITGASGGLGRVAVQRFAERGSKLVLVGTNAEKLEELVHDLGLPQERYLALALDMSAPASACKTLDEAVKKFGRVDILLNFVGGWIGGAPVARINPEDLITMIQQHIWTTFYLTQAFVPQMISNGWGRLVVISSPSVAETPANGSPYTVAKSGQEALMLTLANELNGTGVTANVLRVRTIDVKHERDQDQTSKTASWTTPEEITEALFYLCSDEARTVNGARIPLYGNP
jgi:NAD(P)-dependent dehydrogenase (short-subunit alcohol dehydrogenase family)